MIRISVYHWLPVAENMLFEIENHLRALAPHEVNDIEMERDAVTFHTTFKFSKDFRSVAVFPLPGKINQRGFCQHVLTIAPIHGLALNALLNELVPELVRSVSALLYAVLPDSARSKLAILRAGVAPFQQFQVTTLDPPTEQAAPDLLMRNQVTAILLDERSADYMRAGFSIPNLHLDIKPFQGSAGAFTSELDNNILFFATEYTPDEWAIHDSVIYKYCALVLYARTLDYVTLILRQARDHIIPLRRRLALTLQGNVAEQFETLIQIKRYLMYVNIKLPVIQKISHHLRATRHAQTFMAKLATFDEPIKVFGYPTIRSIENTIWQPPYLIGKIDDETLRLETQFDQEIGEIQIISDELSQMLESSLLSEQLQVAHQALDALQANLEIERSAKNLANANRTMAALLIAGLGMLIANTLGFGPVGVILIGILTIFGGSIATTFALKRRKAYFRLVIPVRANFAPDLLAHWLSRHKLLKQKANGNQITYSWQQAIPVHLLGPARAENFSSQRERYLVKRFDVTVDLLRRGFLNTIIIETEHFTADFDSRDLVEHIMTELLDVRAMRTNSAAEASVYVQVMSLLGLALDEELPALNNLLALPAAQLSQLITTGASAHADTNLSKLDLHILQDLNGQLRAYQEWLRETLESPKRRNLLDLIGAQNIRDKLTLLKQIEEERIHYAQPSA